MEPTKQEARTYLYELVYERIFGREKPRYVNDAMQHGIDCEWEAAQEFANRTGLELRTVGFVTDDKARYGCSPDRLVAGDKQAVEIKCPEAWTQIGYLLDGPGEKYEPQVQGQLLITGCESVHFWSWHPDLPAKHVVTHRNETFIRKLSAVLDEFCYSLEKETERLRRMMIDQSNDTVVEKWASEVAK